MAKFVDGDLVPLGNTLVRTPGGWFPDANESDTCGYCFKQLDLIPTEDGDGRPTAQFGREEDQSSKGIQCCSPACAILIDLDVTGGLESLARYLERPGSALPPIGVGFNRVNAAGYVRDLLARHTFALNDGHHVKEIVTESAS
jgi:hypothetical protein